jgi:hypothetical protein
VTSFFLSFLLLKRNKATIRASQTPKYINECVKAMSVQRSSYEYQ